MVTEMTENNMGLLLPKLAFCSDFSIAPWQLLVDTQGPAGTTFGS